MRLRKFYQRILRHKRAVILFFVLAAILCVALIPAVAVNYDMMDYLPEASPSTEALRVLEEEYALSIPNCRVMIRQVSLAQALALKIQLQQIDGVSKVNWLDDSVSLTEPLEMQKKFIVDAWYQQEAALFSLTLEKDKQQTAIHAIEDLIGETGVITGTAANSVISQESAGQEIVSIMKIVIPFCAVLLALVSVSWLEPVLFLVTIGFAIVLNMGTNLLFGEISYVTKIAGSVLQLAVSLDYSLFLLHRFEECRKEIADPQQAMVEALCLATPSILASGLTTVMGFAALMAMEFGIGADLGRVLAKGIAFSLFAVLVLLPVLTLRFIGWVDRFTHRPLIPTLFFLGRTTLKLRYGAMILFFLVLIPSFLAQSNNAFYYGSSKLYGSDTLLGQQQAAVEEVFGQSNTFVLLVPKGDFGKEQALNEDLQRLPQINSVVSYVQTVGAEIPMEYLDEAILSQLISEHYSCIVLVSDVLSEGDEAFALVQQLEQLAAQYYGNDYQLAGDTVSTFDLKKTIESDQRRVNLLVITAIFLILLLTMKSLALPLLLLLVIEASVWLNLSVPYFADQHLFFIAYLIISSIQLGATVDYAILMGSRYQEERQQKERAQALVDTVGITSVSIMTPAAILAVAGFMIGFSCTNASIAQLGMLLGRGALISCLLVLLVLPACLYSFDPLIVKKKKRV